ncbi:copper amine oxidase N-terminal domain-containing protein [Aceticella autotrophica]|uniref:Copper amine oxidase N-terminal domain-containing protein n=1 Tax=Aceticella autotrophica TaxID=2755338 RepID=A0A975AW77_9THEO|nr:copper amine oxidase N-terminal domain-containing protein [Aceticella autotrophica]QSZ27602.1 copper amine oxidase N-terminal domain-containing protein [Aceticella autotrophica]
MLKQKTAKALIGVMLCSAALSMPISGLAKPTHKAIFTVNQTVYNVDDNNQTMDVKTLFINNRSYVPIRYLAYALGVKPDDISWSEATQTATLTLRDDTVITLKFTIGSYTYYVNNQPKQMDVAPIMANNRTYLPARFVAEAFGYKVDWNESNQEVLVYPPNTPQPTPQPNPTPQPIYNINAVKSGNIQPPANAIAPADVWGFPLKATRAEMHIGSRYAKITDINGNTYNLDLGAPCYFCTTKDVYSEIQKNYPGVYNDSNTLLTQSIGTDSAFYMPVIPVMKAFGVPEGNIAWDGKTLIVFGWDGKKEGYLSFFANSKASYAKWHDGETLGKDNILNYPLLVINGIPYIGVCSCDDLEGTIYATIGSYCSIINGRIDGGGYHDENGTFIRTLKPGH